MPDSPHDQPDQYSPEETQRRLDRALKRSVTMPPKGKPPVDKKVPKPGTSGR